MTSSTRAVAATSLAAFLVLALTACNSAPPAEQPTDQLTVGTVQRKIEIGMSSADVIAALGSPNIVATDDQRREVWTYDRISTERVTSSESSWFTIILAGTSSDRSSSSSQQRTLTIILRFDEEQKVRDFDYHSSRF